MFKSKSTAVTFFAFLGFVSLVGTLLFFGVHLAIAVFTGPTQAPPGGTGAIGLDVNNNLSVGASSPSADTKFLIVPAGTNTFGLRIMKSNGTSPLLIVRETGQVGIATGTLPLPEELTVQGDLYVSGNITGGTISGAGFTGNINAANVEAGQFGSIASPGGNYSFPDRLSIGALSTVDQYEKFAVSGGNVRIGEFNPATTTIPATGDYGRFLYFSGGPAMGGTWDSDNSDPLWIARYNVSDDQTEFRVSVGDNPGPSGQDAFVVGMTAPQQDPSNFRRIFLVGSGDGVISNFKIEAGTVLDPVNLSVIGGNVAIGTTTPAYKLDVNGAMRLWPSTQPAGANGVIYYSSSENKFKCYQNSGWTDCIGGGSGGGGGDPYKWIISGSTMYATTTINRVEIGSQTAPIDFNVIGNTITLFNNPIGNQGLKVTSAGLVGIWNGIPRHILSVGGAIQLDDESITRSIAKPTCSTVSPGTDPDGGTIWFTRGSGSSPDTLEICARNGSGNYGWRPLF